MGLLNLIFGNYSEKEIKRIKPIMESVLSLEEKYKALSDDELKGMTAVLKDRLSQGETLDDILPDAFATCREASFRVLGMKHYPVQILGGIVLHQGRISEMKTGEGKTLVATLPAYLNALSGKGVHIVTVNDYLAQRDSEWMGKVYRYLGLEVGLIVSGMQNDEKQKSYSADITYCTNNELGFDYLRDNMVIYKEKKVQRGHNFAIVDEVDSILIDEARTPLIISGQGNKSTDLYKRADSFARTLKRVKVRTTNDKQTDEEQNLDGDYIVDEKAKSCTLTASGVALAEKYFGIENLNDEENIEILHHINQAIRAHGIMEKNVDYIVKDGEILIVDEFTGRTMYGRRYNEGLHQAIEAKEGVKIRNESKTLATITFQNFFRLYNKLSGMTGTAMTEEQEFREIYRLDVVEIPTNKELLRKDLNDVIFKSESAKFKAVINEIVERNQKGQPVLVGTITIEKSEKLSSMLKKRGIKHNVLNAKHHEREAEIIAQAGKFGAVTIATNMAGRGTDIMLGGNAEYLAKAELKKMGISDEIIAEATGFADTSDPEIISSRETYAELLAKYKAEIAPEAQKVREAGGLCIIGTERHESRRIDNQLRGRSGRQGDPGVTHFYISLEDDLMRLFGGERLYNMMETLKVDEDMPLEMGTLTKSIESAQKKKESQNFAIRKSVLEFDNVMNTQRDIIYTQRDRVLNGENLRETVLNMARDTVSSEVGLFCSAEYADDWNLDGLKAYFAGWVLEEGDLEYTQTELSEITKEDVEAFIIDKIEAKYEEKEKMYGEELMRDIERVMLLRTVDEHWMEHIDNMDELRDGMHLRAYGQHDPVVEYRNEGYDMFNAMTESIKEETAKRVLTVRVRKESGIERKKVAEESGTTSGEKPNRTIRGTGVVSKNALCPCGSGLKYKRCCGKDK